MKKDKKQNPPVINKKKTGPGSDPENKFKKGSKGVTAASVDNIIKSATGKTIARTGSGLANEGTSVSYEEER